MTTDNHPTALWKLRRDEQEILCQARLAAYGIEVDIVRGGKVALTRVFDTDTEALAWAEGKRALRESDGWIPVPLDRAGDQRPAG